MRRLLCALCVLIPASVSAATIHITSGTFVGTGGVGGLGTTTIGGDGFSLTATGAYLSNAYVASLCESPRCQTITPDGVFSGGDLRGDGVLDGVPFQLRPDGASAYLRYTGPTVPFTPPARLGETVTVELPFTLWGMLTLGWGQPPYTVQGEGVATLVWDTRPVTPEEWIWRFQSARYEFVNPLAVPEPASLLLLSTGLLALWRKQIRMLQA